MGLPTLGWSTREPLGIAAGPPLACLFRLLGRPLVIPLVHPLHWPDVADVELWPLAVLHAAYVINRLPRQDSGQSPLEIFSKNTWPRSKFHDFHVWGCPVYILDSRLADGRKIPR